MPALDRSVQMSVGGGCNRCDMTAAMTDMELAHTVDLQRWRQAIEQRAPRI